MPTRYNSKGKSFFGVPPLPSGYGGQQTPSLSIPSVGLEDTDRALFNLFDKEIPLQVNVESGSKKIPVVFASGEKWALLRKGAPRDRNGSLVLPIIVIGRTNISQTPNEDIAGRGINQQTGEIIVRRRLDSTDREYQNLINRLLIQNQTNVAVNHLDEHLDDQITTGRVLGDLSDDPTIISGGLMKPDKRRNIWETIVLPTPQFYTATYDVIVWTNYIQHMNQIIENIISSFLPQGNQWRLDTSKGYWFIATVDGNLYNSQNNFEDFSQEERMIKYQFSIKVPGYIFASTAPGMPIPIRRYVSNPDIVFSTQVDASEALGFDDPYLGVDDPTLPHSNIDNHTLQQRNDGKTRLFPNKSNISPQDPALQSYERNSVAKYKKVTVVDGKGRKSIKHVKLKTLNAFTGEAVFSSADLDGFSIIVMSD